MVWALKIYLMTTGSKCMSSMKLHRDQGVTQSPAWYLADRIRDSATDENPVAFSAPVAVDETYLGGKERNKSQSKRVHAKGGPVGKTPVVGMHDSANRRVVAEVVPRVSKYRIWDFVESNTDPSALVVSHKAGFYHGAFRDRVQIKHSEGEYAEDGYSTNAIGSFRALFERGYVGTYRKMSAKHLHRYVCEFAGRHNARPLGTDKQMELTTQGLVGKRLTYAALTAGPATVPRATRSRRQARRYGLGLRLCQRRREGPCREIGQGVP